MAGLELEEPVLKLDDRKISEAYAVRTEISKEIKPITDTSPLNPTSISVDRINPMPSDLHQDVRDFLDTASQSIAEFEMPSSLLAGSVTYPNILRDQLLDSKDCTGLIDKVRGQESNGQERVILSALEHLESKNAHLRDIRYAMKKYMGA